jgi:hypothetical protein
MRRRAPPGHAGQNSPRSAMLDGVALVARTFYEIGYEHGQAQLSTKRPDVISKRPHRARRRPFSYTNVTDAAFAILHS